MRRAIVRTIALLAFFSLVAPQLAWGDPVTSGPQRAFLTVKLNGRDQGTSLVVIFERDAYILASDLKDSNLVIPGDAYRTVDGQRYVSLRSVDPNVVYTIDADALAIDIRFGTGSFGQTTLDGAGGEAALPISYTRSAFFNYSVLKSSNQGALFSGEGVASIGHGVLDTFVQRNSGGGFALGETSWTRDYIEKSERLVVGRSNIDMSDFSGTGSTISLDGVTFRRDLQLNPGTIRNYNTGISGVASSASTVQLFVNGVLVREEEIGAGAFRVSNVPLRDGANETTVVIRDAFGHTQTISRPMYVAADLYRRGDREFAFALGRSSFQQSQAVRPFVGAARYAVGITDAVTAGARAQVSGTGWNAGSWLAAGSRFGQLSASVSESVARGTAFVPGTVVDFASDSGLQLPPGATSAPPPIGAGPVRGTAYGLSYNGAFHGLAVGASLAGESPFYSTIALPPVADRALRSERIYVSGGLRHSGTGLTFSWSRATFRDSGTQAEQTLSLMQQLLRGVNASVSYGRRTLAGNSGPSLGIRIDAVLRRHDQVSLSSTSEAGKTTRSLQLERHPDGILGTSYAAAIGSEDGATSASFDAVNATRVGNFEVRHAVAGVYRDTSVSFSGAIAMADGGVFFTRPILQSFVVVDTGLSGIRALVNSQTAGLTDRKGRMLIADLFPYQRNDVSIDPNSIPDGALLDVTQRSVAPTYRGGAVVKFAVHQVRAYSGRLVFAGEADRSPALGQVTLTLRSGTAASDIGTDGTFYFEDLEPGSYEGRAEFKGGSCSFTLVVPHSTGPLTALGTVACARPAPR